MLCFLAFEINLARVHFLLLGTLLPLVGFASDEPAVGLNITSIYPSGWADQAGLTTGDLIVEIDGRTAREFGTFANQKSRAVSVWRAGRGVEDYLAPEGVFRVEVEGFWKPEIAFLAGEIGSHDPHWLEEVADAVFLMDLDPMKSSSRWEDAITKGYPDDDLLAFAKTFLDWKEGKAINLYECLDRILEHHERLPPVYYQILENLTFATADFEVAARLRSLDEKNFLLPEAWANLGASKASKPLRETLLERAESFQSDSVTHLLKDGKTGEPAETTPPRSYSAPGGSHSIQTLAIPEEINSFHCRIVVEVQALPNRSRFFEEFRVVLLDLDDPESNTLLGALAGMGVARRKGGGSSLLLAGTGLDERRSIPLPLTIPDPNGGPATLPDGTPILEIKPEGSFSAPLQFDLVHIDGEMEISLNRTPYIRIPVPSGIIRPGIGLFASGVLSRCQKFECWSLSE